MNINKNTLDFILENIDKDKLLCNASLKGYTEIVKLLLENGANIHARNDYPLCWSSEYGHTETVKLLKEYMEKEKSEIETIKIGNLTYNKKEIEEKLKDIKPLDS